MTLLKAIVVDDEEFARSSLFFLLKQNCPTIEIIGVAKSVVEAKDLLDKHLIDLIFLDIAMPEGNGFELVSAAAEQQAAIVFTTAYDQYAIRAIKANAVDYLLKPIDIDELREAVEKVEASHARLKEQNIADDRVKNLADDLSSDTEISKITIPFGNGFKVIDVSDIVYIEADSNYSDIHLISDEKITVSKILREFEELLSTVQFFRVHKSTLVNLNYLTDYSNKNGLQIFLKNGVKLNVSRRRATNFFEKMKTFKRI